jgi:hypothetical protein
MMRKKHEAKSLGNDQARINAFAAPWPGYLTPNWVGGCQQITEEDERTGVRCRTAVPIAQQGQAATLVEEILVNFTEPANSSLSIAVNQAGRIIGRDRIKPGKFVISDEDGLRELVFPEAENTGLAVLVDASNGRALLGDPNLISSVFTQLFFLEGRHSNYFEEFDDRLTFTGSRVLTWKVDWDGQAQAE